MTQLAKRALATAPVVAALLAWTTPLGAQTTLPRAATPPLALPSFEPPPRERGEVLPPADVSVPNSGAQVATSTGLFVRELEVSGNTVLPAADVQPVLGRFTGRLVSFAELLQLRDEITALYIQRGYVTSGAVLPAQAPTDGLVKIATVEGSLAGITVNTDRGLRQGYVRDYLESFGPMNPVNVLDIEQRLQVLQSDPGIRRVDARLLPGEERGLSILDVRVAEDRRLRVSAETGNLESPAIGAWGGVVRADLRNLAGRADVLSASVRATEGLREYTGDYTLPINARGTSIGLHALGARSEIVQAPFDQLGIEAKARSYGLTLSQAVKRSFSRQAAVFITGERRHSESFLLGSGFSFTPGPDEGEARITVMRTGAEYTARGARDVFAARGTFSFGVNAFGATIHPGGTPDGRFTSFLGQLQWARRLTWLNSEVVSRLDVQVTDSPLLGMEQIAIGGRYSVRGYRENSLVRDNAAIGSVELRIPLLRRPSGAKALEIVPFVDWSYSSNVRQQTVGPKSLGSAGLGVHWAPIDNLNLGVYWGHAFSDLGYAGKDELQDHGFHIGLSYGI